MLGTLTEKMQGLLKKMAGKHKLTEENISEAISEVRLALLEADVNYSVAKTLIKRVKEKALGDIVIKSVTPGQQFIKVVHDELVGLMGTAESLINLQQKPAIIMVCGLQGSGKTTFCAKLAKYLKKQGDVKNPLLAACDLQRPAAVQQLKVLAEQIHVPVVAVDGEKDPLKIAKMALEQAKTGQHDLLIVDTAGRLHIDEELMLQLEKLKALLKPAEVLFIANAATGQEAVNVASEFSKRVEITGSALTMLDGNTRGGAAISIREVTGKPLKFEGIGEKIDDLQVFNPASMADRILGMGDTINLVKKAKEHFDESEAKQIEKKLKTASFTYEDYLKQIQSIRKMGPLKNLINMIPGMGGALKDFDFDEKHFYKIEATIQSMTKSERAELVELSTSRRKRISKGSGVDIEEINRLVKSFKQAKQFFKQTNFKQLEKMMGGSRWH